MIESSASTYSRILILFALAPASILSEMARLFTNDIIEERFEQHVAIARMRLELNEGGDFTDWYSGGGEEIIDRLDKKAQEGVTTGASFALIGLTAPFALGFEFGILGVVGGLLVATVCTGLVIKSMNKLKRAIERTPKEISNEH
ncbi:hypothetical protein [Haloarcula salinisoli]|uniref:Uncharacterized protein n=1 Tax=Haloarcula salinisoli TaxID=2487746 RepID=A0A8J7YLF6_9EURY|nr:hypothetical protein [Halomicroarcula salinisoli]MBX0305364.1 hypothetical protein [Halomicroarcula salinisoli]